MLIREMTPSELDQVVDLCLAGSEPTPTFSLGPRYLRSQFSAFLESREGCALTCWDVEAKEVVGYVCGTQDLAKHYSSWLRRNALYLLPTLLVSLRDPAIALGLLRRARRLPEIIRLRRDKDPTPNPPERSPAMLMQVLVRADRRRHKVGSMLVEAFTDEMSRRGIAGVELWVRAENTAARRLYEHLGWIPVRSETVTKESTRWLYRRDLARELEGIPPREVDTSINRNRVSDSADGGLAGAHGRGGQ